MKHGTQSNPETGAPVDSEDLVKRLRLAAEFWRTKFNVGTLLDEAADHIETVSGIKNGSEPRE